MKLPLAVTELDRRLANLPKPTYPEELPVVGKREEIAHAIEANQVVIVCGETGSGKTTQLPKICLELGRGVAGLIGHTQPRRIAARTVAMRIASELNSPLGHAVGYKVRFSDSVSKDTYIKLMTDGILLAETQGDPLLRAYDTIIIDEAHERSLNIDFLLGYLKQILVKRPDLKLIVTSATIDAERFSRHFHNAPVIEVSGRLYPVEVRYRPLASEDEEEVDLQQAIIDAVDELMRVGPGDTLIFLPGEREIRETAESLRKHAFSRPGGGAGVEILPLFARLSFAEQERVFKPGNMRRIVLATNVAETSLTVPGIRYVIDTGLARVNRYSYRNKVEQLLIEKISQASANQRAGRCGRVMSGICVRLYGEEDYRARPEFTDPEILRSSLAAVILRMKSLKIGDVENFPFIQPPLPRMIADGYQLLTELGAVDDNNALTAIGWRLAKFPIDPKIARMILAAKQENCLSEILIIASALSLQDPRDRPFEKQEAADRAHEPFRDERSDFLSFLKLWEFFDEQLKHKKSNKKLIAQCQEHFISHRRMREWREIHGQLHTLVMELGFKPNQVPANYDEIHRALLAGLLGNIGFKSESEGEYLGARGIKFSIFPGSSLKKAKPKWIVAAELTETAKLYARCVAAIDPSWLENIAGRLCKKHYFDPHWEKQPAQVAAYERVTLYGLTIVPKRRVAYGRINPKEAREIFIRNALVAGEYATKAPFFEHNRKLIETIEELEHKARRQDVLVDEQEIFAFYDAIIPADIYGGAAFEKWRKQAEQTNPQLLYLTRDYLMRHAAGSITEVQFPETLNIDGHAFPLNYRFEPGHVLDGVTITIPLPFLNKLTIAQFDWLVPGLVREKITWYFKSLPKQIRRNLVPVPDYVTRFLEQQEPAEPMLLSEALARFIQSQTGIKVPLDSWDDKPLPLHLQMNYKVIDDAGKELAMSRNLTELQAQLGQAAQLTFAQSDTAEQISIERDQLTRWDFGDLPEEITFTRAGKQITGYPALVDQTDHVAIRLFDTRDAAASNMRAGVRRLLSFELKDRMKQLEKNLPGHKQAIMQLSTLIDPETLKRDMLAAISDRAFIGDDQLPRSESEFNAQKQRARLRLSPVTDAVARLIQDIAQEYQTLKQRLAASTISNPRLKTELTDQLNHLIYPGFLHATNWERLPHLTRYLKGMVLRLDKYASNPSRDGQHAVSIAALWNQYLQRLEKHRKAGISDPNLTEFRWQIEELRISLFAQELKTPYPVSVKRLQKFWETVRE
ncbi:MULTISPECIES: ATP-dependent RNA helicase HrpA [Nitrosomonas]|uniref:ATP-dependent helicase n=1 Tax=Nitrosomonas communis TaxID=44574 RepID=A0A0F7KFK5_9PROT|nr:MULTISPECIES: ATP-dependent RNA helicase HrpA [Nitrosomonas]AKH38266.1 ATP-dependent helicase [Nitrosomonas communis]TYP89517.1 ATP-dependent helicase HrpA [Nitrosomonas communis]UVS63436.1 ATP-dependent RNA helicase HrpA [Nitrosomonas sp. PLL12]